MRRQSEPNACKTDVIPSTIKSSHSHPQVVTTTTIHKDYDPQTGNKLLNNYMILKEIGRGVHGKVKLAVDLTTNELVAIKIVDKKNRRRQMGYSLLRGHSQLQNGEPISEENEQKIRREIAILKKCSHPNVVRLYEVIDDPTSRKIYMALEYTESGEIEWRDQNDLPIIDISDARAMFRDIVCGLDYLHYQGIIHRDIKPANLLLSRDHVAKISDFGVSYFNEMLAVDASIQPSDEIMARIDRELAETAGTPAFFAPELCCAGDLPTTTTQSDSNEKQTRRPRISKAIDVWALGVTLYCFIYGRCPFIAATEFELFDTIPIQPLTFPKREDVGFEIEEEAKDLLTRLLTKNPDERITLEEVKHHPWVTADLNNPEAWIKKADPHNYLRSTSKDVVENEEVTMMDRLRRSIHKLSLSFGGLGRRQSKPHLNLKEQTRPLSYQTPPPPSTPTTCTSQPLMSKQPSYSASLLPHATSSVTPTVSLSTGHTLVLNSGLSSSIIPPQPSSLHHQPLRPISSFLSDDTSSIEEGEEEDDNNSYHRSTNIRPSLNRRVSSASSSSGIGLTFGRYRGGMTPIEPPKK
ncbi:kinase-like protein [Backusella circina FSU 941]|nr:kinase-like protein [Backusella circina FSU 941]